MVLRFIIMPCVFYKPSISSTAIVALPERWALLIFISIGAEPLNPETATFTSLRPSFATGTALPTSLPPCHTSTLEGA